MNLLVSDFDKTLFDKNYKDNIKAVNEFVDSGNMFIIATGRHLPHLLQDLGNVKYKYLICNDGAIIYDDKLNCIFKADIEHSTALQVIDFIKPYVGTVINNWYIDTSRKYTKDLNTDVNAIIASIKNEKKAKELLDLILNNFKNIDGYIGDYNINLRNIDTSKSEGIKLLIAKEDIDKSNVYTIGDNINDISMLQDFNGYCMAGGANEKSSMCTNVVSSVSELIEKIKKS